MNMQPYKARLAKKRRGKPGSIRDVTMLLWEALRTAEMLLHETDDPELLLRCVNALAQAAGQYGRLLEVGELESRLAALEASLGRTT